jgi:hypothetical protein
LKYTVINGVVVSLDKDEDKKRKEIARQKREDKECF